MTVVNEIPQPPAPDQPMPDPAPPETPAPGPPDAPQPDPKGPETPEEPIEPEPHT
jgi:segregation and condensation protein B